ncbi:MAG: radical SAM family heme chaperone HemW [Planctomycetota bacterium]|nr:MAG: radical SAM family heme chaperone HemW [Planctomycetota bacterium]KAB2948681.1 MAG: radical SAM family heme chaperone HemW [Phycisphaerae bacterium]MCQ3922109.1 coproporphyrinogen III oxidase [Planctomycetota bacterium]
MRAVSRLISETGRGAVVAPVRGASAGLYVHIPFCHTKCGYCDFYSVPLGDRATAPLVQAVTRELKARVAACLLPIRTIFVGGGTPTVLDATQLRTLLAPLAEVAREHRVIEFTVEANPATVDDEKADLLVSHGVTRVSMGAQSFDPRELAALERLHSPEDIPPSVRTLRRAGVAQVNLDLIFGIPGQTLESWSASLSRAVALEPDHVACYGLTYEPGTRLTAQLQHGGVAPCDEELEAALFERTVTELSRSGYEQYEISNYARPGCRCEHNLMYWRNEPYLGVGPSAAGCIGGRRYKNVADIGQYVRRIEESGSAEQETETLTADMLAIEFVMMQLRLTEGLSLGDFRNRIGVDLRTWFAGALEKVREHGWVEMDEERIALTRAGRMIANHVMAELAAGGRRRVRSLSVRS